MLEKFDDNGSMSYSYERNLTVTLCSLLSKLDHFRAMEKTFSQY